MKYERLTQAQKDRHPSIHRTGSVRGMKNLDFGGRKTAASDAASIFTTSL